MRILLTLAAIAGVSCAMAQPASAKDRVPRDEGEKAMHRPDLKGTDRIREVFARVRAGDPARVAELYAKDGKVLYTGGEAVGHEAITAFYRFAIDTLHPQPQVEAIFGEGPQYVALVNVPNDKGSTRAADLFTVGERGIVQLEIFSR
jgi:hypothetical protein